MQEAELKALIQDDPGNPAFAEYGEVLRAKGDLANALIVCLSGLSLNPKNHRGRLVLARTLFELRCVPFAVRELKELATDLPDNKNIKKLLEKLSPELVQTQAPPSEVLAESEFDIDILEAIKEEGK